MKPRGFTLIELIAAMSIVAVLMVVAAPSYRESVRRAHRIDAHDVLFRIAALQERHHFQTGRYADSLADLANPAPTASHAGHYSVTVTSRDGGDGFIARAVPSAGSPQRTDSACLEFSLDDRGERGATGSADASRRCWR